MVEEKNRLITLYIDKKILDIQKYFFYFFYAKNKNFYKNLDFFVYL